MIGPFIGPHRFLSNFFPATVEFEGQVYPSVEHAFQAAKTLDPVKREEIRRAESPGEAKRLGRNLDLRPDWSERRVEIMQELVRSKFREELLRSQLVGTGQEEIVEVSAWGDRFWGVHDGMGENRLGKILMEVREEARKEALQRWNS